MSDFIETADTLRARLRRESMAYDLAEFPALREFMMAVTNMTPGEAHCVLLDFVRTVAGSSTRGNPRRDKDGAAWAARNLRRVTREWRAGETISVADIPPPVEQPKSEAVSCGG